MQESPLLFCLPPPKNEASFIDRTAIKRTESVQAYIHLTARWPQTKWGKNPTGRHECPGPDHSLAFNLPKFTLFSCFPHMSTVAGFWRMPSNNFPSLMFNYTKFFIFLKGKDVIAPGQHLNILSVLPAETSPIYFLFSQASLFFCCSHFKTKEMPPWCLMLWWGYSTRQLQSLQQNGTTHLGKALKLYSFKSLILALFPSFFSHFLQNATAPKLSWDSTQHYKPLHFPCSN